MTCDEYRARVRALGLTPCRRSYDTATLHQDRDGEFCSVADPEFLTEGERRAFLERLMAIYGHSEH